MSAPRRDDPVLVSARREMSGVLVVWLVALVYTTTYSYLHGYGRDIETIEFVWGVPDWVAWGIFAPWLVCYAVSLVYAFVLIRDDPLGAEGESDLHDEL